METQKLRTWNQEDWMSLRPTWVTENSRPAWVTVWDTLSRKYPHSRVCMQAGTHAHGGVAICSGYSNRKSVQSVIKWIYPSHLPSQINPFSCVKLTVILVDRGPWEWFFSLFRSWLQCQNFLECLALDIGDLCLSSLRRVVTPVPWFLVPLQLGSSIQFLWGPLCYLSPGLFRYTPFFL